MTKIKKETINITDKKIWGKFYLTDKSITKFEIRNNGNWYQWGNIQSNLCLSVGRIMELSKDLLK